jgi:S-adenosylmethionine hydrolase
MIVLFTDFGLAGPYTGQVKAVLHFEAPQVPVIDLFADAPTHNPKAAAYLLAAYAEEFPRGPVFLAVVDPGVGGSRRAGVLLADDRWYVGPENGLFELVMRRSKERPRWWHVTWRPERLSPTFHGRDLFAPVAARIAKNGLPSGLEHPIEEIRRRDWLDDLDEIVYVDGFGNAMSGVRASVVPPGAEVLVAGRRLKRAQTFSDVSPGQGFWYENANGLLEIAVNMGRADRVLGIEPGSPIAVDKI